MSALDHGCSETNTELIHSKKYLPSIAPVHITTRKYERSNDHMLSHERHSVNLLAREQQLQHRFNFGQSSTG